MKKFRVETKNGYCIAFKTEEEALAYVRTALITVPLRIIDITTKKIILKKYWQTELKMI